MDRIFTALFLLISGILCITCVSNATAEIHSQPLNSFNPSKLHGKYKLQVQDVAKEIKIDSTDDGWEKFGKGLAKLAIQNLNIQLEFLEEGKGNAYISGGLIDFFQAFSEGPIQVEPHAFEYQLKDDSAIYVKNDEGNYNLMGYLSKFNSTYDSIRLHNQSDSLNYSVLLTKN